MQRFDAEILHLRGTFSAYHEEAVKAWCDVLPAREKVVRASAVVRAWRNLPPELDGSPLAFADPLLELDGSPPELDELP